MAKTNRVAALAITAAFAVSLLFALPTMAFADDASSAAASDGQHDMAAQAAPYKNKYASYWDAVSAFISDERFKPGTPWTDYQGSKLDYYNGNGGCAAYVSDFGYFVFGSDSFSWPNYENPSEIQAGDCLRVVLPGGSAHSFVVLSRNGSQLETIEGNYNLQVEHSYDRYTVEGNTLYMYGQPFRLSWGDRHPDIYSYDFSSAKVKLPEFELDDNEVPNVALFEQQGTCPVEVHYAGVKLTQGVDYQVAFKMSDVAVRGETPVVIDGETWYRPPYYRGRWIVRITGLGSFAGQAIMAEGRDEWYSHDEDYFNNASRGKTMRLAGNNALDTMQKVVEAGKFKAGGTVVLANAWGYHDALTAAGIAGLEGAPVVMTDGKALSAQAKSLLASLKPAKIVVCGGTGAVSDKVVADAKEAAGAKTVERAAGSNAAATAVDIYRKGSGWAKTAIVATSGTYHDALAAAPLSYAAHLPIFMTEWTGALSSATIKAMQAGGITQAYIAGGTYWIPDSTAQQLEKAGIKVVKRLAGDTAVETSSAIAAEAIAKYEMKADNLGVATTASHYDALAGAAFCGAKKSVMLLVNDERSSSIFDFMWKRYNSIGRAYVFGGTSSVNPATYDMIKTAVW